MALNLLADTGAPVNVLEQQFFQGLQFSRIGNDVLVCVNPLREASETAVHTKQKQQQFPLQKELDEELISLVRLAWQQQRMKTCIVLNGESESGKTEVWKKILRQCCSSVGNRLLACGPLLEGFGAATTLTNDSSSRYLSCVDVNVEGDSSTASVTCHLLDKARVTAAEVGERNYHIFY